MFNRNHMLVGGVRPHLYCLPILKRNIHQQALRELVASGFSRAFLGTDSARTPAIVKKPAADAPAALTRRPRWAAMQRCLKR
jgi:dihydroorotase